MGCSAALFFFILPNTEACPLLHFYSQIVYFSSVDIPFEVIYDML